MRVEYINAQHDEYVVVEIPQGYTPPNTIDLWHQSTRTFRMFVHDVLVPTEEP